VQAPQQPAPDAAQQERPVQLAEESELEDSKRKLSPATPRQRELPD